MRILQLAIGVLQPLFWGLIIFGFEEPYVAISSIISAVIHECGHLIMMSGAKNIRGVLSGFRISSVRIDSYRNRILGYLGGPLANIIAFLLFSILPGDYLKLVALLNLATAFSNLLPIEGYDGYGIILSVIEMRECSGLAHRILSTVSTALILLLTLLSLYLMDRADGGYWIFTIFFSYLIKTIHRDISKAFLEI